MKKILSILMCLFMILCTLTLSSMSASAETYGDYQYEMLDDGTVQITGYTGELNTLEIPAEINGKAVSCIGNYAFERCASLTSIIIPDSVISIGYSSFSSTSLNSVTIGKKVKIIGEYAFSECTLLKNIIIPDCVTSIGDYAFSNCDSLVSITIPDSVTNINNSTFMSCDSLISITIPDSVISIGNYAFSNCTSLKSITIPDSVTSIGNYAFEWCASLTSIIIPDSVISIGNCAFENSITIYGYSNSEAQRYAKENGINFVDLNHTHSYTVKITKQATCTQKGIKTYICSCGKSYTETIPTKSHGYKWVVTKKASYVSTGIKSYKCSVCGKAAKTTTVAKIKLKTPSFSVSAGKKLLKVKYTKATGATGFQVKYTIGKKIVTRTFNTTKSVTKTISGLKKGSYIVQVRAFAKQGSKTAYSSWTKAKTVKIK